MGRRTGKCGENVSAPVSVERFRQMCADALASGSLAHSRPYYHRNRNKPLSLSHFLVLIDDGNGQRYPFRLDHALCLMKLEGDTDYLGEKIKGAVLYYLDGETCWTLFYTTRPDGNVPMKGRGSIDHVVPRAAGGADALSNMQMSRAGSNFRKADTGGFSCPDQKATEATLDALEAGAGACDDEKIAEELSLLLEQERLAA